MGDNALAIYSQFDQLQRAATALQKSGFFPDIKTEAQAIVKVMAGAELGLPPFASMSGIHIIQGKPVLGANVIATLVKNDPRYDYRITECNDKTCVIEWYDNGKAVGKSTFTMAEANAAGLTGKDNWKKYPSDMLFARTISRGARRYAPGIFGGSPVYTPDEMGVEVDEEGYVDTQFVEPPVEVEPQPEPEVAQPESIPSNGKMSLQTAMSVKNSKDVLYGELDTETLSHMANSIAKKLSENGLTQDKRDTYEFKRDAIAVILASRQ